MAPIRILSDELKNQIAAGEVIERPSAVVKELVENSLDAGAKHVLIEIRGGGIELVRVLDDGDGIEGAEVPLAFARHATSKLHGADDLWRLATLGFRGEALPSIAAVAYVRLFSRTRGAATGRRVALEGGRIVSDGEAGGPVGTEVVVEGLFANTPARLKYLKNKAAEGGRVTELVTSLALARPEVALRYVKDGREVISTPGRGDPLAAIQAVYGLDVAGELLAAFSTGPGIVVEGYVSRPGLWRANRWQEVFTLNGRVVENRVLSVAAERAYGQLLPAKRYPVALLYLTLESTLVDVNVHPAKKEVRFAREDDIFQAVYQAVEGALTGKGMTVRAPASLPRTGAYLTTATTFREDTAVYRSESQRPAVERPAVERPTIEWPVPAPVQTAKLRGDEELSQGRAPGSHAPSANELPGLRYTGQVLKGYLVCLADDGVVLVDQHAAHERIIYEALKRRTAPLVAQELLAPEAVELSPPEWEAYREVAGALEAMGFAIEEFGGRSLLLRAVPMVLGRVRGAPDLRDIIAEFAAADGHEAAGTADSRHEETLIRIACKKGAVKAGEELRPAQAQSLLAELQNCEIPLACPHGRPTMVFLDERWLARAFGREG